MIETYDLLLTYGIFAVFAYVDQITATLWLDYGKITWRGIGGS